MNTGKVFSEPDGTNLAKLFAMAHDPQSANAGQCGNCQGTCFCRRNDKSTVNISDLL